VSDAAHGRHEIRLASTRDLPAVHNLERDVFGVNAWSLPALAAELEPETTQPHDRLGGMRNAVVAVVDGALGGYALSRRSDEICDIVRVAVSPRFRRIGLGTALVEALLEAQVESCTQALLEVDAGNVAAISCYRRLGFTAIDRRPRYYPDGADALVMQRLLSGRGSVQQNRSCD
jgi:[ribosomal protein S18]-alanine N-acetyltransferase